jgi:hypothetical protein
MFQRIQQRLGLQQPAAALRIQRDRIRARCNRRLIPPHQQLRADGACHRIAERQHLRELESGIDVQQREGNRSGKEGFLSQPQHHGRIFADGVQHHRPLELRRNLAKDVDALRLQQAQVTQPMRLRRGRRQICRATLDYRHCGTSVGCLVNADCRE